MRKSSVKTAAYMAAIPRSPVGFFGSKAVSAVRAVKVVELMSTDSISAAAEQTVRLGCHGNVAEAL